MKEMDNLDILLIIFEFCDINTKIAMSMVCKSLYKSTSFKYGKLTKRCEIITALLLDKCLTEPKTTIIAPTSTSMIKLVMNYARGIVKDRNIVIIASVKAQKIWINELKELGLFDQKDAKKSLVLWNSGNKGAHLNHLNQADHCFVDHHIILSSKSMFAIDKCRVDTIVVDSCHDTLISREIYNHKVHHIITLLSDSLSSGVTVV